MIESTGRRLRLAALAGSALTAAACADATVTPIPDGPLDLAAPWVVASPADVGLDAARLQQVGAEAGQIERMRSLVVVRDGRLAFERYYGGTDQQTLADVRSVTKSVVATLVGIAIELGHITSPDQSITDFLSAPEYDIRPEHEPITIRHILTMTGGFDWFENGADGYTDWIRSADHIDYLLERPVRDTPGSVFIYNSAAVHLLGAILEEATGEALPTFAARVLFEPLGIVTVQWEPLLQGRYNGGSGIDLRPRDLARLGQLYLQGGVSGRRSVAPRDWLQSASSATYDQLGAVGPIGQLGYGYLWWTDEVNDAFFAWGYGGQFVYVQPSTQLVVVATTEWRRLSQDIGSGELQRMVLEQIVDGVLPALR